MYRTRSVLVCISSVLIAGCARSALTSPLPLQLGASARDAAKTPYRLLYSFEGFPSGSAPTGLTAVGGVLYGTTTAGGNHNGGTLFARRDSGALRFLHTFGRGPDGAQPEGSLVLLGGTLYGTTQFGGKHNNGTVFAVTPAGKERVVYAFKGGKDGANPLLAGLAAVGNALYGTTNGGGDPSCRVQNTVGCGTVFRLTASGKERVLYRFRGKNDGALPSGTLVADGSALYGTTNFGGARNAGTLFKVTVSGNERVIYAFRGYPDGANPYAGVTELGGAFYGTTAFGGAFSSSGTIFKISTSGSEAVLHNFGGPRDGAVPFGSLTLFDGVLYGTTRFGGRATHRCVAGPYSGCGTLFAVDPSGTERVLYRFQGGFDGADPWSGLVARNKALYGTTFSGGASNQGSIFTISPPDL